MDNKFFHALFSEINLLQGDTVPLIVSKTFSYLDTSYKVILTANQVQKNTDFFFWET